MAAAHRIGNLARQTIRGKLKELISFPPLRARLSKEKVIIEFAKNTSLA
ncbi:hypothetical protein [Thermococcus sibiricus]|uniref:Uncharacterized protein n=1 Tax=Thermococcus sibiricus (strain DSM 12597 / MM 739) TaxID=604354 RepID=C6A2V4_THESM|nr:hypothetical protein [Thermococcus sibiricus]ACS89949.1 hypothetical protein TSIB_0891 [Thermococcus sibiricus MM 739]MBC7095530.1 hypothetical protein [Thermococcus sp.]